MEIFSRRPGADSYPRTATQEERDTLSATDA
jgi:hypothetical protein